MARVRSSGLHLSQWVRSYEGRGRLKDLTFVWNNSNT